MKVTSPLYSLKAWKLVSDLLISQTYRAWIPRASWDRYSEGSRIFRRLGKWVLLERYYIVGNPRTAFQQEGRSAFKLAVAAWQELSPEAKASWNWFQDERRKTPVMSGYNLYIRQFLLSGGAPEIPAGKGGEGWQEAPDEGGFMLGQRCLNERCLNEDV